MRVFVSHASQDRDWAEWVTSELRSAGHEVEVDVDWHHGDSFMARMRGALDSCDVMVALFSPAYFVKKYTLMELDAWLVGRETGLAPLRIVDFPPPTLYRPYINGDLFGHAAEEAVRAVLLQAVSAPSGQPAVRSRLPVDALPSGGPGTVPQVWSVPSRNPGFVGRDDLLAQLRQRLTSGARAVVQALHGWGGVGKSQLAIEYAHRYAGEYDLVWWIESQRPELIGDQVATLAVAAGVVPGGAVTPEAVAKLRDHLRVRGRWLLIFDNAEKPDDIHDWLPGGTGHVLITSRHRTWTDLATAVEIDTFSRAESIALLREQAGLSETDADALAPALGDLPLAIAQAAGYLVSSGMTPHRYVEMLAEHAARVMAHGQPTRYPTSLAASIAISLQRLTDTDPAALAMVRVCSLLAPEPLPVDWFLNPSAEQRPTPLQTIDAPGLYAAATTLGSLGLARPTPDGLLLHRLTQAVIADSLSDDERANTSTAATALIVGTQKGAKESDPRFWPVWQTLLPHILALDPATSDDHDLRWSGIRAVEYRTGRGDYQPALPLAERLHAAWRARLGDDHFDTLAAANVLADAYHWSGDMAAARILRERTLATHRRLLGDEHRETLVSSNNLAESLRVLGEHAAARALFEQALAITRRLLGDEHRDTLIGANNLAITLDALGEHAAARTLHEQTLAARRRVLGDDHPLTLTSANNLAIALSAAGEQAGARTLFEQTLATQRRVLGDEHPATLASAHNVAVTLCAVGEQAAARTLYEQTLAARRRVLGDDHPQTLRTANNLATTLSDLADWTGSRAWEEWTLTGRRRALGDDHPDTLQTARNLTITLRHLGEHAAADALEGEFAEARARSEARRAGQQESQT